MIDRTFHFGSRDPNGSWKTNCMCCRAASSWRPRSLVSSLPRKLTVPDFGRGDCRIARARVDLPDPVSPTMPSVSPGMMSNETPETAWTTPPRVPPPSRTTNSWTRSRTDSSGCFSSATVSVLIERLRSRRGASRPRSVPGCARRGRAPWPGSRLARGRSGARTSSRGAYAVGSGGRPVTTGSSVCAARSMCGIASSSARVYRIRTVPPVPNSFLAGACSTILPAYITTTSSA